MYVVEKACCAQIRKGVWQGEDEDEDDDDDEADAADEAERMHAITWRHLRVQVGVQHRHAPPIHKVDHETFP